MESQLAQVNWYCLQEADYTLNSQHKMEPARAGESDQLWYRFQRLVSEYTNRSLTVGGDRLDAFSAVLQQVKDREGEHFVWGIPASRFHVGLCWEPAGDGLERITCKTTHEITSLNERVEFPSWTWIGWQGAVTLMVEDDYLEHGIQPEIVCFVLRNKPPRLVSASRVCFDDRGLRIPLPSSNSPFAVTMNDMFSQPGWSEERIEKTPDDQILVFWTEVVRLHIVSRPYVKAYNRFCHSILDASGQEIGFTSNHGSGDMKKSPVEAEFILLASHTGPEVPPSKIVLQVKWENGIARRLNIGEVNAEAWEGAKPERILVLLG